MTSTRRPRAVAVVLLTAALAASVAGCGLRAGSPKSGARDAAAATEPSDPSAPADQPGPVRTENGVPVGWSLNQDGAEAAAAGWVRSTGVVARSGPLRRRDALLTMATSSFGPTLVREVNDQLDGLTVGTDGRGVSPEELVWHEYPLTVTSTESSSDTVVVRVWSVMVIGVEGGSVARQLWRTSTLTLVVESGDWKVADWTDERGPSPVALSDTDLASVDDVSVVAGWSSPGTGR